MYNYSTENKNLFAEVNYNSSLVGEIKNDWFVDWPVAVVACTSIDIGSVPISSYAIACKVREAI